MLIGAIGDVVSSFVTGYTEWVGNNAQNLYQMLKALFAKENKAQRIKEAAKYKPQRPGSANEADAGFHEIADVERRCTVPVTVDLDRLSEMHAAVAEEKYRPMMMLKAAQHIMKHLDESPPRRYTYKEWSWLLKLLGEDETNERGHRRVGQPVREGAEIITPVRDHKDQVWSWLGQESPLMSLEEGECLARRSMCPESLECSLTVGSCGTDSEPKWVLKKLMEVLSKELQARAERHIKRDIGDISDARDPDEKIEESSPSVT